jgi:hypothetical protein
MTKINSLNCVLACALMIGVVGCKPKPVAAPKADTKATEGPMLAPPQQPTTSATPQADHAAVPTEGDPNGDVQANNAEKPAADATAEAAKIKANLASFTTEDRALAEKQKVCPVSGEALGTMGPPKKMSIGGHDVFICCQGCEKELTSEPDKYLTKLGLQPTK